MAPTGTFIPNSVGNAGAAGCSPAPEDGAGEVIEGDLNDPGRARDQPRRARVPARRGRLVASRSCQSNPTSTPGVRG